MARVLMPIPRCDFDPTETAIPWHVLTARGHEVVFATPDGAAGAADELMLTGEGLDVWGFLPLLRKLILVGGVLRANADARAAYAAMRQSEAFQSPLKWEALDAVQFDAVLFPGGHRARGMREYLESPVLQEIAVEAFAQNMPVGAICHGVVVLARSVDPHTNRSVLYGRKTTALTWKLEGAAQAIAGVTRFWDRHYYRTYRDPPGKTAGFMSVEQEVTRALAKPDDFQDVPTDDPHIKPRTSGTVRDSDADLSSGFVVRDGAYVSARWPGDAHAFAHAFADML
ncbi:type 1 glutamine amidotransferase domain-containing protein [Candidatus Viadribacter manganicus]|uniref:ThiJ/pfpI-family protein n=1 Tax=Candidatus Viadribacter manganicus TaxID=1759059 RepID=A0A1B1ADZ3_9PROT|nr:type 1 glutamine amidotransferase domain-containing protein [Candidatus Viadribacter manganicus]ANP44777.1 thiJ/pfpI-family protein [Candidatus Viadribacter manganicus]